MPEAFFVWRRLPTIRFDVTEKQVLAQHQELNAGLNLNAGTDEICCIDIKVFVCHAAQRVAAEIGKGHQRRTTAFGNRGSSNDQAGFARDGKRQHQIIGGQLPGVMFIRVLSS